MPKVIFDYSLAVLILPFALIGMAILYLPVKLTSRGPFIFKQKRIGRKGKPFNLYKIRTMKHCNQKWSTITLSNDKRITKIGAFLRKYKLDELPQIFNIFKGNISFVGPRPIALEHLNYYPKLWEKVLLIKPGITGIATLLYHKKEYEITQKAIAEGKEVHKIYNEKILPNKLRLNNFYAKNHNLCLDIKILWWTFLDILFKNNKIRRRKRAL